MTQPTSPLSFEDCFVIMDAALRDERGVRMKFPTEAIATQFRLRCHRARVLDRERNKDTYTPGTTLYGTSVYDKLILRLNRVGDWWCIDFERNNLIPSAVESLTTGEVLDLEFAVMPDAPAKPEPEPPKIDIKEVLDSFADMPTVEEKSKGVRRL